MKKILFPTDFSDNAANALDFSVEILNRLEKAHLILFHAYNFPSSATSYLSLDMDFLQDAEREMNRVVNRIQPKLAEEIVLQTSIERAETVSAIRRKAEDFDLIIMGTQGASGLKEIFLGSISNGVISHTKTPVLIVPEKYRFQKIEHIVLALDNNSVSDTKGVAWIKGFQEIFGADLMLFHTEEKPADRGFDNSVTKLFDKPGYSIDFNFLGKSIQQSIEEMAVDYDVDLLCMVKRKRSFLASLFHSSVTSKEVFHTKIPLLILHD